MTPHLQNLQAPVPVRQGTHINLPTGSTAAISYTGTVAISPTLSLNDVLCVPNFKHNLLSVQKLLKHNSCEVKFLPTHCIILDNESQTVIAVGEAKHGLYYLVNTSEPSKWLLNLHQTSPACFATSNSTSVSV